MSTVWILGAGFSKSLGGPLLRDLLTSVSGQKMRATFPEGDYDRLYDHNAKLVRSIYETWGPARKEERDRIWEDAEAFLDALDTAAAARPGSPSRTFLERLVQQALAGQMRKFTAPGPAILSDAAKRLVGAECCQFLVGADMASEPWGPYVRWAQLLKASDAIISFNYDRVVEHVMDKVGRKGLLNVVLPGTNLDASRLTLLKVHGSVDWEWDGSRAKLNVPEFALGSGGSGLLMGTPGPTKRDITQKLSELWNHAHSFLGKARDIVFLGYRFPPTDSDSRQRLLAAISANEASSLRIQTVLGPSVSDADTVRLERMLQWASAQRRIAPKAVVDVLPLWAQDFLDIFDPKTLVH
jgi:hypothetical protein